MTDEEMMMGIAYHPELYRLCEVPGCMVRVKKPRTVCTEDTWDAKHMIYALEQDSSVGTHRVDNGEIVLVAPAVGECKACRKRWRVTDEWF